MRNALAAVIMAAVATFLSYAAALPQTQMPPKPVTKVLLDNANIQEIRSTYAPGARTNVAALKKKDPATMAYIVDGPAHVQKHYADGHVATFTFPTGSAHYDPAGQGTYRTNVGSNSFTWVVVVFKK